MKLNAHKKGTLKKKLIYLKDLVEKWKIAKKADE